MRFKGVVLVALFAIVGVVPSAYAGSKYPTKIISLSPSATENLFAIGAGKSVIAVDSYSNYPKSAPRTKIDGFTLNVEAIAKYKPDLVVIQSTAAKAGEVVKQLNALKIKTYVEITPVNISAAYAEISDLGKITGHSSQARFVVARMKKSIAGILAKSKLSGSKSFFHELDSTLYSATSSTFIGKVYASFGLTNIADAAATADSGGYPQLQSEYVIKANPAIIFLADSQYGESATTVAARPGWSTISAVQGLAVIPLPADIPSRWGPRLVDFYRFVAQALALK